MKKSVWAAGIMAVVAVAAGGGWLAVHTVETKTARAVRDLLTGLSATVETVDYDWPGNTLRLENLTYGLELAGQRNLTSVESVVLTGFDRACLDPAAAGPELPLVADSLVAAGLAVSSSGAVVSQGTIAELRVEGWHQNLGRLAALYREEPWGEAFFVEAYRYRVEMLAYKDYRVSVEAPDRKPLTMSMALAGLLGPAGSPSAGGEAGRALSLFANDIGMDVPGLGAGEIRRVEMRGLLLPPPAAMSRFMAAAREIPAARAKGLEAVRKLSDKMVEELAASYQGSTPYQDIVLQGYVFRPDGGNARPLVVDEVRNRLSLADPFVFGLDVTGFHGDWDNAPREFRREGRAFLPDGFLVDGSLQLTLRPDARDSAVAWSAGVRNLGRVEGETALQVHVAGLGDIMGLVSSGQIQDKVFLTGAEAAYTDQGLTALVLAAFARNQGLSVEALRSRLTDDLPALGREAGNLGPMLEKAASVMLDRPGTVRIQCRPQRPLSAEQAFMALLMQPRVLNLTVSAEPGAKPLADWIPAALKRDAPADGPDAPAEAAAGEGAPSIGEGKGRN